MEGLGNKKMSKEYPDDSIKIGSNIENNPGDLRRLDITQTSMENHQLTLVGKTLRCVK